jgi:hypothetical protein
MTPESFTANGLLKATPPSLAGWYADPVAIPAARTLLDAAQRQLQTRLCQGGRCFPLHVLRMICHFWMHSDCALEYRQLSALAGDVNEQALLELVYGQLLISGKRLPAREHLARGFSLAAPYLDTTEYFLMVRQHELLACLALSGTPAVPRALHSLLTEAAVIRRLQAGVRRTHQSAHCDTLG